MAGRPILDRKNAETWETIFQRATAEIFWADVERLLRALGASITPGLYPAQTWVVLKNGRKWVVDEPPHQKPLTPMFIAQTRRVLEGKQ